MVVGREFLSRVETEFGLGSVQRRAALGRSLRAALSSAARRQARPRPRRWRADLVHPARSARSLAAPARDPLGDQRDGRRRRVHGRRRRLAAPAPPRHVGLRPRPPRPLLPFARPRHRAPRPPARAGGTRRRGDRSAGAAHALHRRRHRRPGLRLGRQHPRRRPRRAAAASRQGLSDDLSAHQPAAALLALPAPAFGSRLRPPSGRGAPLGARLHRPGAPAHGRRARARRATARSAGSAARRARDADGSALSEEQIAGNVLTVLLAGEDTTANTLAWTLYLLHRCPEAWQALVAEVDAVLGDARVVATLAQARRLEYVEACVQEAMRLRPVAPLLFLEPNQDVVVGGFDVPKGTSVFCIMRKPALDPALGSDATAFSPARWLAGAGEGSRALHRASMPFGAGPRLCPGRYLALVEMKMVLSLIARNYTLESVATRSGAPPRERLAFAMFPVGLQ